jgi:membrane associated rhomboid family serine protease
MAFFQDTRPSREPFINAPATVLWLIAAILAAHVARVALPVDWSNQVLLTYAFVPARYSTAAFAGWGMHAAAWLGRIVPFVSYMFVHADFGHAGINCLWLLAFGPIVARRLGPVKFLAFFFLCGLAAAAVHLAVNWGDTLPVIGASGAISGLMAAGIRILYGSRVLAFGDYRPLAPVTSRSVIFFTVTWVAINIIVGVTNIGVTSQLAVIAWVAHLGGYFAGLFAVGLFDKPPLKVRSA